MRSDDGSGNGMGVDDRGTMYTLTGTDRHSVAFAACHVFDCRGYSDGKTCHTITGSHEERVTDDSDVLVMASGQTNAERTEHFSPTLSCDHEQPILIVSSRAARAAKLPRRYIARRLTPTECQRLQGFPDGWGTPEYKTHMDDEEQAFWENVRRIHALINGKHYRRCATPGALIRWYNRLHTDSAEYQMWGNGIALPCAVFVMEGIAAFN